MSPPLTLTAAPPHRGTARIVAAVLALMLLIGLMGSTTTRVAAERVGPGGGSFATYCGILQDQYHDLKGQLANVDPTRDKDLATMIRYRMSLLESGWRNNGCQDVYGDIDYFVAPPTSPITGIRAQGGGARLAALR